MFCVSVSQAGMILLLCIYLPISGDIISCPNSRNRVLLVSHTEGPEMMLKYTQHCPTTKNFLGQNATGANNEKL